MPKLLLRSNQVYYCHKFQIPFNYPHSQLMDDSEHVIPALWYYNLFKKTLNLLSSVFLQWIHYIFLGQQNLYAGLQDHILKSIIRYQVYTYSGWFLDYRNDCIQKKFPITEKKSQSSIIGVVVLQLHPHPTLRQSFKML